MRSLLSSISLAMAIFVSPMAGTASALSLLHDDTHQSAPTDEADGAQTEGQARPAPAYVAKPALSSLTMAIRENREFRRMFAELNKGAGRNETALSKYIRALDIRYAVLSAVGNSLVNATTPSEAEEASAIALAILAVKTDLDRAVLQTQMAIVDSFRRSGQYFNACGQQGKLADGTKCDMIDSADGGETHSFWAHPWDIERLEGITAAKGK